MVVLICLLLQQTPTLTPAGSLDLEDLDRHGLAVSSTGKYVVVGESSRLRVFEAETLKPVTDLPLRWTAFRFDERDDTLLVVGDEVTRVATSDWTVRVRAEIPRAQFAETPVRVGKGALVPRPSSFRTWTSTTARRTGRSP